MPKKPQKFFVGMPRKNSQGNSNKNFGTEIEENFPKGIFRNLKRFFSERTKRFFSGNSKINFVKFGNKLVTKRVAKDIDPTRVKRIELTNKEKIRNRLETQAYFPQQSTGFLSVLRKTILDYFLPFPPPPPLEDPRNIFPENKKGSQR